VEIRAVDGIYGLNGLEGYSRNQFLIEHWHYPDVGVVFCHFGHAAFMLDYSTCGSTGEPCIIYVDRERPQREEEPVIVSPNFASLIAEF
jgi:hypothetical protein